MKTIAPPVSALEIEDIQGLVARSFAPLKHAVYVPLAFDPQNPAGARAWVGGTADRVTAASVRSKDVQAQGQAVNVAFTSRGLEALGLPKDAAGSFSLEFQDGMAAPNRTRVLGDTGDTAPETWRWGGPKNAPVHAMLFLFASTEAGLRELLGEERRRAGEHGVTLAEPLDSIMLTGDKEHFGFHDGIAQPRIAGIPGGEATPSGVEPEVPGGEVVLGYPNAYGELPDTPSVADTEQARALLRPVPPDPDAPNAPPRRDLGRNGTYVVFRQLEQDVKRFWSFADERTRQDPESPDPARRKFLASKIVGRWPNGAPLVLHPKEEPATFDLAKANDFMYTDDLQGDRCPIGAHVRRTNPRDGMGPTPAESLLVADRHRLLRRGRAYGKPLAPSFDPSDILKAEDPENGNRGLHFICFNTDLARQFEFVQNTWVNSMKFDGLYSDPDALIAPHVDPEKAKHREEISNFTVQRCPVRHRETKLPRFVTIRGGAYLFMPGLKALRYLAGLR